MSTRLWHDSHLRRKTAESSPKDVLLQGVFWKSEAKLVLLLVCSLVIIALIFLFTYRNCDQLLSLLAPSLPIYLLLPYGFYLAARSIAELEVEHAIAIEVNTSATEMVRGIVSGQAQMVDIDRVEQDVIPNNTTQPEPAMIRMFHSICTEAKDRKFESRANITLSPREESLKCLFDLQNIKRISLWLGILGTFIGLILAIFHLAAIIKEGKFFDAGDSSLNVSGLTDLFSDLHISFSTSVAGLEVSIVTVLLLMLLRSKQDSYFRDMDAAVTAMLSLVRRSINKDEFIVEFEQVGNSMKLLKTRIENLTLVLSKDLQTVGKTIEIQTDHIQSGINNLVESKATLVAFLENLARLQSEFINNTQAAYTNTTMKFDSFLSGMSEKQKQFINDIETTYKKISLKNIVDEMRETILHAGNNMAQDFEVILSEIAEVLKKVNETASMIDVSNSSFVKGLAVLSSNINNVEQKVANQTNQIGDGIKELSDVKLEFDKFLEKLNFTQDEFVSHVKSAHSIVTIQTLSEELQKSIANSSGGILNAVRPAIDKIAGNIGILAKSMESLNLLIDNLRLRLPDSVLLEFSKLIGIIAIMISGGYAYYTLINFMKGL